MAAHETARKKKFTQPRVTAPKLHYQKDWYSDLLKEYHSEKDMFKQLKVDQKVFEDLLEIVRDIPLISKGRTSYFRTHKSKLLLLILYLQIGKPSMIAMLTTPEIKTSEQILRSVKNVLQLFGNRLIEQQIFFRREIFMNDYACIIDCTVIQRKKPETTYKEALP